MPERLKEKEQLLEDLYKNVYQLEKSFEVKLYDKSAIVKMAKDAGEVACYVKQKIEGAKKKEVLDKAKKDAEEKVLNDYFAALEKYQKNENKDDFNKAINDIADSIIDRQVKVAIVKDAESVAKSISNVEKEAERKKIMENVINNNVKLKMQKLITGELTEMQKDIRKYLGDDRVENRINERIEKYKNTINEKVANAKTPEACETALKEVMKIIYMMKKDGKKWECISGMEEVMDELKLQDIQDKDIYDNLIKVGARKAAEIIVGKKDNDQENEQKISFKDAELQQKAKGMYNSRLADVTSDINKIIDNIVNSINSVNEKEDVKTAMLSETGDIILKYNAAINKINNIKSTKNGEDKEKIEKALKVGDKEVKEALRKIAKEALRYICEASTMVESDEKGIKKLQNKAVSELKVGEEKVEVEQCLNGAKGSDKREQMVLQYKLRMLDEKEKEKGKNNVIEAAKDLYKDSPGIVATFDGIAEFKKGLGEKLLGGKRICSLNPEQLIQEWYRLEPYAAKDPPRNLSLADRYEYRQKYARREQIENILSTNENVHWFHRLHFCVAKAYETATDNNYWFREKTKGTQKKGIFGYLSQCLTDIKAEMELHGTPQTPLERSRAAFLHQAVQAIHSAMSDGDPRQTNEVLLPVLGSVLRILNANLDKRELAEQVLVSSASPEEAKKILEEKLNADSQKAVLGLDKVKDDQSKKEPSNVDLMDEKSMDGGHYFEGQTKLKRSEFEELRGKIQKACYRKAGEIFKSMLDGLNSEKRAKMEVNKADMIKEIGKQIWEDYQKGETRMFELYKLKMFSKEIDKQRWKDMMFTWAFICMQNGMMMSNRGVDNIMKQLLETVKHGNA